MKVAVAIQNFLCGAALLLLIGCGQGGEQAGAVRGVSDTEVVIGSHVDLSGPIVAWGSGLRNGMILASDEINARGGIHGRKLRLVIEDNGYDPKKAVLAARKLASRDRVFAVIGAIGSPPNAAALPVLLSKGIFNLFPIAAVPVVYHPHHRLKFVNETPMGAAIRTGIRYFYEKENIRRFGLLYQDDDYGVEIRRGVELELAALGLKSVETVSYKRGATDFSAQIARLRNKGAELILLGTVTRETAGAARAAQSLGWKVPMLCPMGCYAEETADLAPAQGDNIYAVAQVEIPYADSDNVKFQNWRKRYEARFGVRPNIGAVRGTTSINLFAAALERAGRDLTPETFLHALESLPPWQDSELDGAPIDYSADDHIGIHSVFMARLEAGRWRRISGYMPVPRDGYMPE